MKRLDNVDTATSPAKTRTNRRKDKPKKNNMSTPELSTSTTSRTDPERSEAKTNEENVVTVFDLASEIEQSLKDVIGQVEDNDKQFQKSFKSIQEKLKKLES